MSHRHVRRSGLNPQLSTLWVLCLVSSFSVAVPAQEAASVAFTFDFPGSEPEHYVISVSSGGHAKYSSDGKLNPQSETSDPFQLDFTISQPVRTHIFDLAKRAHYFEGEVESKKKGLALTGVKTLAYKDAQRSTQASYNYSRISEVQELTTLFQNLSMTLEFGRRLEYYHRYQKLALDDELKRMEEISKQNGLEELSAVAPILQQIANDSSVINPVRVRAQRLLARGKTSSLH
jgi:hypothetical protein